MILVPKEELALLAPLFSHADDTMIRSCLDGCMGSAWADRLETPSAARILTVGFSYLTGNAQSPDAAALVSQLPDEYANSFLILVPLDPSWEKVIETAFTGRCNRITRHAIHKKASFDRTRLEELAGSLPDGYRLEAINPKWYEASKLEIWSLSLCASYPTWEAFQCNGLGFVAVHGEELACGASSYCHYCGGIEVEVDTNEPHRRKGLAAACAARLILECLDRNLSVTWDAANWASVYLAEKLGYRYDRPYCAYEIDLSGQTE